MSAPGPYTCVLFDLDGTITDSAPGITQALAETFTELGLPVPPPSELLRFVGPPILDSFQGLMGMTEAASRDALVVYRRRYEGTLALDSPVFPGIVTLLDDLVTAGIPLAVATGKPRRLAQRILEHLGLAGRFAAICGASDDETVSAKSQIVALALDALSAAGHDLTRPIMIGDRHMDVDGAGVNGVPTLFVRWGYGSDEEAQGAHGIVDAPAEIGDLLLGARRPTTP